MRTGRPRSFDRDEALEAAVTVFWRHGYDATSISMLTEALGISAPSLYAAFTDKQTLFLEVLDRYLNTYGAFSRVVLQEEPNARNAVDRLLREAAVAYTRADQPHGCLLITATTNCGPQSADVAERLRKIRAAGLRELRAKLAVAVRAGELPDDTDTRALARFYSAVLQGMSAQARDGATRSDLKHIAANAMHAWPAS
ncbi:MAG TPA: TetR/AcrR family transcriptional regulator [Kribbella sp.]|nr:TetR/AcrR family transcriptional regulator [Kribbella sp.]